MFITVAPVGMLGTNCYLVESRQKNCVVIDPGAQPHKIMDLMEQKGMTPRYILLTHGHHDHIGAVGKLLESFPELELYIGEADLELLSDPHKSYSDKLNENVARKATGIKEGREFVVDDMTIRAVETPGHTKGGITFLCQDAMFCGDTLFHGDCGRCDLYGGDYEVLKRSLKKLADLEGQYVVYPGHGPSSTLEYERRFNHYMLEARS